MKHPGVVVLLAVLVLPPVASAQQFDQFERQTIEQWIRTTFGQEEPDPEALNHPVWGTRFLLSLTDGQREGARLFMQRCNVCHGAAMNSLTAYGPLVTALRVEGREDVVRRLITNGSERMPAFRYSLQPSQVDLIIHYLKRLEARSAKTQTQETP